LATTILLRTDATTTGPAVLNPDGTYSALIPAVVASQLDSARAVRIEWAGARDPGRAAAVVDRIGPADDAAVSRVGLPPLQQPAILLSGALTHGEPSALPPGQTQVKGRVVVVLRSEPV